jgi:LCP family protein required for cell wall assembly
LENEPPGLYLSTKVKVALLLVVGANVLVWCIVGGSALFRTMRSSATYTGLTSVVTPTATYLPLATPTPTFLPTARPVGGSTVMPGRTPTVTPSPTIVPTSVPLLPIGEDTLVFALLGTDEEQTPGSWRTDAIVLAFVESSAKRVSLLSVPRDLWVYIPGHGHERINTVDIMGGLDLLDQTFRYNLGVPVHHYVRVNFHGFVRLIDAVGGVTVNVEQALEDRIPDPLSPTGWFEIALEEGSQHLDGQTTLAYCRSRMTTSDFDRSRRQRQVLLALWQQAFTVDTLSQVPELWAALGESFDTDLSVGAGVQLAQAMVDLDVQNVRSASISTAVEQWTTPEGAWVLLPHTDAIRQAILDLLSSSA